jgi:hypothetical protein
MAERDEDVVARDLAALGRLVETAVPTSDLATAVLQRVSALPKPRTLRLSVPERLRHTLVSGLGARRRRVALVLAAVVLALLAAPPVRAAVADWFGFGAVRVERGEPAPSPAAPPPLVSPPPGTGVSLSDAVAAVDFPVSVALALGQPDGVEVSGDRRRVSMSWAAAGDGAAPGVLRLDQFGASLDYSIIKRAPDVVFTEVNGDFAVWFDEPHEVAVLLPDGTPVTESARLAGHTLIWQEGGVTLRLEGDVPLDRAVEIAESATRVG